MKEYFESNISFTDRIFSCINFLKNYLHFAGLYRKRYNNFVSVMIHVLMNDYPIQVNFHSGRSAEYTDYQQIYNSLMEIDVDDDDDDLVFFDGLSFYGGKTNGDIPNIFGRNEYSFLPVMGKEVLDIGANIGDSSIYFAKRGAKKVVGVEPDRISYECANKNVVANGYSKVIKIILAACASKDIFVPKSEPNFMSLGTLIKNYCTNPEILKIDCEGCEYDLILNTSCENLRPFTHIQIEYHFGYRNLKSKLEDCGFDVTCTRPSFFVPFNKNSIGKKFVTTDRSKSISKYNMNYPTRMTIGWLYASRISPAADIL
jgi:FkbM family methyltransferase